MYQIHPRSYINFFQKSSERQYIRNEEGLTELGKCKSKSNKENNSSVLEIAVTKTSSTI